MKNRLWLLQLPIVILFTAAFAIQEAGEDGRLENAFVRDSIFPKLRSVSAVFTDWKFKLRGAEPPKNRIVIVDVDDLAIESVGRWPWHRDTMAGLIDNVFAAGAKAVGLDIVFSEPDPRVPADLAQALAQQSLQLDLLKFETDLALRDVIAKHGDRLVLGWGAQASCQPLYSSPEECPVLHPDALAQFPVGVEKFAVKDVQSPTGFDALKTPMISFPVFLANMDEYNRVASHAGFFSAFPDPDGYIRRAPLLLMAGGNPYPSLPLELARVALDEELSVRFDASHRVADLRFAKSGRAIPVTPQSVLEGNFRGPKFTFTYLSAVELLRDGDLIQDESGRKLAGLSKKDVLRDAIVLIGVTGTGVNDMRSFPFDMNVPGVEGQATILDNLLSGDMMVPGRKASGSIWMYLLMVVVALAFAVAAQRLEAVPAMVLWLTAFFGFAAGDLNLLFRNQLAWNTGFFYLEMSAIFVLTLAAKYIIEERNKKFLKSAFTKYVAPAVVNRILEDPTKLMLGGEKKELTILFSDIRGFTTFSEKMDAKQLATFLNDYLGTMTNLVFKHDGTLDKYIGDAVMAFWGAPLDQAKHATHCAQAAVAMMKALAENRARYREQYGVDVRIGIGINTGVVNVGNMGSDNNFEYTVIGDHVNLASRLEGLTKHYGVGILVTRFTLDHIVAAGDQAPAHRVLDFVKVKGKATAVELIEILDRDLSPEGLKLFDRGRAHYRACEWDRAIDAFEQARRLLSTSDETDGPCELYIERCRELKAAPPEANWDGSWTMTSK